MVFPAASRSALATAVLLAAAALAGITGCTERPATLSFWFDPVTYSSSRFGGPVTVGELETIENISRSEIGRAFAGLPVVVAGRQDARYRVRVVQALRDPRFRSDVAVAGASRALSVYGGDGAVNFSMLAAYAESYAPADADRPAIVAAIGRGVGRAAVHEFAHQLLGSARMDATADRQAYEFGSAARREQYYGDMHWAEARSALYGRFGVGRGR